MSHTFRPLRHGCRSGLHAACCIPILRGRRKVSWWAQSLRHSIFRVRSLCCGASTCIHRGRRAAAVNLILEALVPSALQLQQTVFASGTPPVWDALSFGQQDCSFQPSATLSLGSSDGSLADHPRTCRRTCCRALRRATPAPSSKYVAWNWESLVVESSRVLCR